MLHEQRIVSAAIELIRQHGLPGLTMRALSRRLGVAPSALYNHVPSRAMLLARVQDHVSEQLDVSGFGSGSVSLRDALSRWAWSYLRFLRDRPAMVGLIVVVPVAHAASTTRMYQRIASAFRAAGWYDRSVIPSLSAVETFIFGAALDSAGPEGVYAPEPSSLAPELTETHAAFAELVREAGEPERDLVFQLGLDAMLAGLQHRWGGRRPS